MDLNIYTAEKLAEARLREHRAMAARCALLGSLRPRHRRIRTALGNALIRAGRWLGQPGAPVEPEREIACLRR